MKTEQEIFKKFQETVKKFNSDPVVLEHLAAISNHFESTIKELKEFLDTHANKEDFRSTPGSRTVKSSPSDSILIGWVLKTHYWRNASIFTQMLHRIIKQDSYDSSYKCDMGDITHNEKSEDEFLNTYPNWFNDLLEEMDND
jgi:hypothetical protein